MQEWLWMKPFKSIEGTVSEVWENIGIEPFTCRLTCQIMRLYVSTFRREDQEVGLHEEEVYR